MSERKMMTVTGVPGGDMECWCLNVTEQEYRKVAGTGAYRRQLTLRKELEADGVDPGPWRLYPQDLVAEQGHKVEIKIKTRRV